MTEACDWYLIHTKVRQERCAQENLERQGHTCFLPKVRWLCCKSPFSTLPFIRLDAGLEAVGGVLYVPIGRNPIGHLCKPARKISGVLVAADCPFIG